jgi:homoserine acetyltransferase
VTVIGNSFGGWLAAEIARDPGRGVTFVIQAAGAACPADHTFRTGRFIDRPESGMRIQRII